MVTFVARVKKKFFFLLILKIFFLEKIDLIVKKKTNQYLSARLEHLKKKKRLLNNGVDITKMRNHSDYAKSRIIIVLTQIVPSLNETVLAKKIFLLMPLSGDFKT